MAEWTCKSRWEADYYADSVEWCPLAPHRDILVCGTYQLEKTDEDLRGADQTRLGRIYLFKYDQDSTDMTPIQAIDTPGILDQKWCYHTIQEFPILAAVTSDGLIQLYRLFEEETLRLNLWQEGCVGESILALSVDWSSNKTHSEEPCLVVSDSSGAVSLWKIAESSLQKINSWKAHGFEAWITAFNYWNTNVFYSGGDDCLFKCFDVRVPEAVATNKSHEAGVTAVRSHLDLEHQLITGSYDEKVRLWDARNLKSCITETDVGGGVWRLKWHPHRDGVILAACMYGGFRVLRNDGQISVLCEYLDCDSIAYGADWRFCDEETSAVVTCSFYDRKMHVGQVKLPNY